MALPGVQEKLSAGMLTLPARLHASQAILKVSPPDNPGVVINEAYFLDRASGLRVPVTSFETIPDDTGEPGLLVGRFDRPPDGGRLAVEDAAQLLGLHPGDKYRSIAEDLATAVAGVCDASAVALRSVLLQLVWAWLTGNGDLHAKNVSVLQEPSGEWRVAPLYDIPSTLPHGDHSAALSMGGRTEGFVRQHFADFGQRHRTAQPGRRASRRPGTQGVSDRARRRRRRGARSQPHPHPHRRPPTRAATAGCGGLRTRAQVARCILRIPTANPTASNTNAATNPPRTTDPS